MLLYLDSLQSRNNCFKLDDVISGYWQLVSFSCTNNMYNVNDRNNKIYLNENGVDLTATLTNGYYDVADLQSHVSSVLNAAISGTMSISINNSTNKLTFDNSLNFYFTFGTNTLNSARILLGMNEEDGSNALSHTSDMPVDINTQKNILINISDNNDRNVVGLSHFSTSFAINGTGAFSEMWRYVNSDNFDQFVKFRNTKRIQIRIHDLNNNDIDLNSNYVIILKKCSKPPDCKTPTK